MIRNRWFIIVNPMAGGTTLSTSWKSIAKELESLSLEFDIQLTEHREHAAKLVIEALEKGYRKFIGIGGDGTNNEIINGIFKQDRVSPYDITYALLPFGTGNDWSRMHQIPRKVKDWYEMLQKGKTIRHSIGKLILEKNADSSDGQSGASSKTKISRYFINIAGFAYDAHIVKTSEEYRNKKRSRWLFLWLVFRCLFNFSSPSLKIKFNGKEVQGRFYTINCGICQYSGGGMRLVPQAKPDDQLFGLTYIYNFSKLLMPFAATKLFSGRVAAFKYAEVTSCDHIFIEALSGDELGVEVDGEYLGTGAVEIQIIPCAINIIVA